MLQRPPKNEICFHGQHTFVPSLGTLLTTCIHFRMSTANHIKQIAKVKNRIASLRRVPNNLQKIREMEAKLDALKQSTQQIDSVGIVGYVFPLRTVQDVNRLEKAVRSTSTTRKQYVMFIFSSA